VIDQFYMTGPIERQVPAFGLGPADPDQPAAIEHVIGGAADVDVDVQVGLVDKAGAVVTRRPGAAPAVPLAGLPDGVIIGDDA
jgi:hypothetical protein